MTNVQTSVCAPTLEIKGLSKSFGSRQILKNITLTVNPGEVFGFLGPNGSGKTTTIKLILGLLHYSEGEVRVCGYDIKENFEEAVANVGGIIENPEMYKYLTGRQNLMQYVRMQDGVTSERVEEVIDVVGLRARIDDKIARYSLGMRQRLGIAQAILHHPKLLILDEPTNGLDPTGIKELRDILKHLSHEEGCSVFVSSHMLAELELMCDRVCVIDHGIVLDTKTIEDIHEARADGSLPTYRIECSDSAAAAAKCTELGCSAKADRDVITVRIAKENVPALLRALLDSGVDVYGAAIVKQSLEDAFIKITGATPEGGVGQ